MGSVRLSQYDQRTQTPEGGVDSGVISNGAIGQALEGAGQAMQQIGDQQQDIANTTAAKRADTQYSTQVNQLLYDPTVDETTGAPKGYMYQSGENALNGLPDVQAKLKAARQAVAGTLTNPVQQRMFNLQADVRDTALGADMNSHAGSQFRVYQDATSDARIASGSESFVASGDPESPSAKLAMAQIQGETLSKASRAGITGDAAAYQVQAAQSKVYAAMIDAGLDKSADGPLRASALLDKYGDRILPTDRAPLQAKVSSAVAGAIALPVGEAAANGQLTTDAAPAQPGKPADWSDPGKTIAGVIGKPVTISSAARTPAQNAAAGGSATSSHLTGQAVDFVPPPGMSTADAAKKMAASGLAFDQIIDEGDHVHVGYGDKMRGQVLTKHGSQYTPTAATASRAIAHVQNGVAQFSAAGGGNPVTLEQARASAAAWAAEHFPNSPSIGAAAQTQAMIAWRRNNADLHDRQRDAWQQVQTVVQGGGSISDIPADAWHDLLPSQQNAATKLLQNGGYAHQSDPTTLGGVYDLMATHPEQFQNADIVSLAPKLAKGDFDTLLKAQLDMRQGQGAAKPHNEGIAQVNRAATLSMPPEIAKDKAKSQAFRGALFSAATAAQAARPSKPLADDEVVTLGHNLAMDQVTGKGIFGGTNTKPLYQWDYDTLVKSAPAEEAHVFRFLKQQNNGAIPTKDQVLSTWRALKSTGRL